MAKTPIPNIPSIESFIGYEPALVNKFAIIFNPKSFFPVPDEAILILDVRSSRIPGVTIETVEDDFFNYKFKYHGGKFTVSDVSMTFRGTMNPRDPLRIFYEWIRNAVEFIGGLNAFHTGFKDEYATNSYLFLLNHKNVPFQIINFINIFPTSFSEVTLEYSGADIYTYDVTFMFERWQLLL